ncbi:MAG TPA: DUF6714 family protein [Archangium sp.]|nr:DUF6714 family protein [Archangium sp.]
MPSSRSKALRRQIEAAFADASPPGDDHIGYDPEDWESVELARTFKGRHWRDLSPSELQYHSSSFLSSEGFRYYLPAYLLAALEEHGNLMPHTVYGLTLPAESSPEDLTLRAWQLERFEGLSPTQKRAVRAFLEYARDEASHYFSQGQEPRLALTSYWERQ